MSSTSGSFRTSSISACVCVGGWSGDTSYEEIAEGETIVNIEATQLKEIVKVETE